jgi:hypothetical protein
MQSVQTGLALQSSVNSMVEQNEKMKSIWVNFPDMA